MGKLTAQHNINMTLSDTLGKSYVQTVAASVMYEGMIGNNVIRFRKLDTLRDGEIKYVVSRKMAAENMIVKLRADTGTTLVFSYTLLNGALSYQYPGKNASLGSYQNGDQLKIIRCKNSVLFFKNGIAIDGYSLANNKFVMYGELALVSCNNSLANVSFKPY